MINRDRDLIFTRQAKLLVTGSIMAVIDTTTGRVLIAGLNALPHDTYGLMQPTSANT